MTAKVSPNFVSCRQGAESPMVEDHCLALTCDLQTRLHFQPPNQHFHLYVLKTSQIHHIKMEFNPGPLLIINSSSASNQRAESHAWHLPLFPSPFFSSQAQNSWKSLKVQKPLALYFLFFLLNALCKSHYFTQKILQIFPFFSLVLSLPLHTWMYQQASWYSSLTPVSLSSLLIYI